ncbi:nickel insertion protein [Saccharicrinis fermentans]|uniref:LarC family nickel insertion protein n=1 Tax=Saccharicrinis fermentans DSM 9555 = JCM 21142 TaxID=869213 RepID=W7YBH0_9BACT|nr:nickel insertion protein [Saccharicrinis fermentans]GAF05782.1 hypothetical protein JCM21142_104535 [Saccharicrinis fermentans DSM 9555 = JCM 21142]
MKLLIDPSGGMAGDMFAAVLISAGADESRMIEAMLSAAKRIGQATISAVKTHDDAIRLSMCMNHNHGHLAGSKAKALLGELCEELKIEGDYKAFALKVLEALIAAEKQAHAENTFLTDHIHGHHHDHHHSHPHHGDDHHHHDEEEAWLHEAQDILIDIIGAAMGLQLLKAPVTASLINPVSLGGGSIKFSHGEMDVPAPATKIMMHKYGIAHVMGPIDVELCTPTGTAILVALGSDLMTDAMVSKVICKGSSRGGKDLPIPPLKVCLTE